MKLDSDRNNLDALLDAAAAFAESYLQQHSRLPVAFFLAGPDGAHFFYTHDHKTDAKLAKFQKDARLLTMAHAPTAAVMAFPGGYQENAPDGDLAAPVPEECFLLMGQDRQGHKAKAVTIIRSDNGKFFALGEITDLIVDPEGPTGIQILPEPEPDAEARQWAKGELQAEGVKTIPLIRKELTPTPTAVPWHAGTRAAFDQVKAAIAAHIDETRTEDPETADYLAAHFVFDEQNLTVCYTGIGIADPAGFDSSQN